MSAYYNENDKFAAQWLRNLVAAGLIPPGDVDDRSILDVRADDLRGYVQHHWFSGIAGWPYALQLAGWPTDRPVWTGSAPCQPFSAAGTQDGAADERHLWPAWFALIRECRPEYIFGEQVSAAIRLGWLDGVFTDLELEGYTTGAAVLGAHSVGAPHIRQRLYWVADAGSERRQQESRSAPRDEGAYGREQDGDNELAGAGTTERVADAYGRDASAEGLQRGGEQRQPSQDDGDSEWVADDDHDGPRRAHGVAALEDSYGQDGRLHRGGAGGDEGRTRQGGVRGRSREAGSGAGVGQGIGLGDTECSTGSRFGQHCREGHRAAADRDRTTGNWADFQVIECGDGKTRRIPLEPALQPLAPGLSRGRVGILRGSGNAIVPPLAAEFVRAFMEEHDER